METRTEYLKLPVHMPLYGLFQGFPQSLAGLAVYDAVDLLGRERRVGVAELLGDNAADAHLPPPVRLRGGPSGRRSCPRLGLCSRHASGRRTPALGAEEKT